MLSLLVGGLLMMIGISPLLLHAFNPSMDFDFCIQEGEFKIRRIPFDFSEEEFTVWGIITYIIHYAR